MVENLDKNINKRPSENPELWKKFLEIEQLLIKRSNQDKIIWIDHHAKAFREFCDEHSDLVLDLYKKDPEELYVRFQAFLDAMDEGD
jgi:oligoribonuclease NrnB/cAMP/cGMP phosphodiesterase (DHH superfamily)